MTRWCKLAALVVGWSCGALAQAQTPDDPAPPRPSRWSFLHRDKAPAPAPDVPVAGPPEDLSFAIPPSPGPNTPPPINPNTGAPPGPPFSKGPPPPVPGDTPPGPDGTPPNGFSPPVPPDAENGFECNPQPPCEPYARWFFGLDYLHWWIQRQPGPPLVTTGGLEDAVPGALGQPHTEPVLQGISGGSHDGVRLSLGYDCDHDGIFGLDASWFWLDRTNPNSVVSGNGRTGSSVLTRPFFNVNTRQQDADPVNIPGVIGGTLIAATPVRLMGADADVRWLVNPNAVGFPRLTVLAGVAFIDLDEKLLIDESVFETPGLGVAGNRFRLNDSFTTYNRFYGGQLGAVYDYCIGPLTLLFIGKVALGENDETLRISGFTTVTEPNGTTVTNPSAGLYAGPGNDGRRTGHHFCVMPQGQFKVAYQFNESVRLNLGYDALWLSEVLRPGNQINPNVNVQPVGGPPVAPLQPGPIPFHQSGLWAQGFDIGVEINF